MGKKIAYVDIDYHLNSPSIVVMVKGKTGFINSLVLLGPQGNERQGD